MPPRKRTPAEPVPPGPIQLELRENGKIIWAQNVYGRTIDPQNEHTTITAHMRPAETVEPTPEEPELDL